MSLYKSHMPLPINKQKMALTGGGVGGLGWVGVHDNGTEQGFLKLLLSDYFEYAENGGKQVMCLFIKPICLCASLLPKANAVQLNQEYNAQIGCFGHESKQSKGLERISVLQSLSTVVLGNKNIDRMLYILLSEKLTFS